MSATESPGQEPSGTAGSFGEESARLIGAFREWADRGRSATEAAAGEANSAHAAHESATAAECAHCPICQGLAMLRGAKPEVLDHLADALGSLSAALGAFLPGDTAAPHAGRPAESVQHIDVTGDATADSVDTVDTVDPANPDSR